MNHFDDSDPFDDRLRYSVFFDRMPGSKSGTDRTVPQQLIFFRVEGGLTFDV
jgi:hypothetical protein